MAFRGKAISSTESTSADVAEQDWLVTDEFLRGIESFDSAIAAVRQETGIESLADILGTGFGVESKDSLIGTTFLCVRAARSTGDQGTYWVLWCVTRGNQKVVISDGGSGIAAQMNVLANRAGYADDVMGVIPIKPFVCRGLRKSEYNVVINGKESKATTFYLDTAPIV